MLSLLSTYSFNLPTLFFIFFIAWIIGMVLMFALGAAASRGDGDSERYQEMDTDHYD